jgi:hypothetical protein
MNIVNSAKNALSDTMDMFNKTVEPITSNKIVHTYVFPVVALLLVLYVVMAAPKLPKSVVKIFDYTIVKILYMFLIVYLGTHNPSLAIIVTVILFISLQQLSSYEAAEKLVPQTTAAPNMFQQLLQKAGEYKDAAMNALQLGDEKTAQANINQAAKLEAAAESLNIASVHKNAAMEAAQKGDKKGVQDHAIMAIKHDMNAKMLTTPGPTQEKCSQRADEVMSATEVLGYNENQSNEDYGHTDCSSDIDLAYNGMVQPSHELFNENFINMDTLMPISQEFSDVRANLNAKVSDIRRYRDDDLGEYAPFVSSSCNMQGKRKVEKFYEGDCDEDSDCNGDGESHMVCGEDNKCVEGFYEDKECENDEQCADDEHCESGYCTL